MENQLSGVLQCQQMHILSMSKKKKQIHHDYTSHPMDKSQKGFSDHNSYVCGNHRGSELGCTHPSHSCEDQQDQRLHAL